MHLKEKITGEVLRVVPDPWDGDHFAQVVVLVGNEKHRLSVTRRFVDEQGLFEGKQFSWDKWALPLLNFLLNPVQEIREV